MPESALHVAITEQPIDVPALVASASDPRAGAVLLFVGTVRATKAGREVLGIDYEAYAPMAKKELERIGREMLERWGCTGVALVHRIGPLTVGDASIAIVAATPHRAEGFEALRHGIESVKRDVPIWKKERFSDGDVWVQAGS
jgi:molybdopterin synthase catalytic subunit